jgi:CBS domain-containing protein
MGFLDWFRTDDVSRFTKRLNTFFQREVRDYMSTDVYTIRADESLIDAANIMISHNISSLVVVDKGDPVGIITERDYLTKSSPDSLQERTVGDIMTKETVKVDPSLTVPEAAKLMDEHRFRKLVVIDDGDLAGIITQSDLTYAMDDLYQDFPFRSSDARHVRSVMKDIVTIDGEETVRHVHETMKEDNLGSVFVSGDGVTGVFTEFDFLSQVATSVDELDARLGDLKSTPVIGINEEVDIFDANHLMIDQGFRRLPVYRDCDLVGKVTQTIIRKAGFEILETTKKRADAGELESVSFTEIPEQTLIKHIHGKVQEYYYE